MAQRRKDELLLLLRRSRSSGARRGLSSGRARLPPRATPEHHSRPHRQRIQRLLGTGATAGCGAAKRVSGGTRTAAGKIVPRANLRRVSGADLFVLPAKAETQPVVLLEAMASHTPWLSTDTDCVSELPGGIVARSEDDLVEKMRELASLPALRQNLAAEGWAAGQKTYDWERVVAAYDRLVTKVCGQG